MRSRTAVLAAILATAPLGARAADLVVWWDEGFYAEEAEAVREIIAAFEQETGKQVEARFHPEGEHPDAIVAALKAGRPPDFAFGLAISNYISEWASDDLLVELSGAIGTLSDLFDPDALAWWVLHNEKTGRKALYALPMGRTTNHLHVWTSFLEQAGFTVEDIPKEWAAFWAFWYDQVQPAICTHPQLRRRDGEHLAAARPIRSGWPSAGRTAGGACTTSARRPARRWRKWRCVRSGNFTPSRLRSAAASPRSGMRPDRSAASRWWRHCTPDSPPSWSGSRASQPWPRRSTTPCATGTGCYCSSTTAGSSSTPTRSSGRIRPIALGRKNALFAGSDGGAHHWAIVASLVATAKIPLAWLTDVLERIVSGRIKAHELDRLLWIWKAERLAATFVPQCGGGDRRSAERQSFGCQASPSGNADKWIKYL
jgi:Bacterial extracellular solute-binding protein